MKPKLSPFRTGNVIKSPGPHGSLWIVSEVHDRPDGTGTVEAISFDSENCSAVQPLEDQTREETCQCGDHPDFMGEPQEDCADCHGAGHYTRKIVGWSRSKVLASSVQEFILQGVKRSMRLS